MVQKPSRTRYNNLRAAPQRLRLWVHPDAPVHRSAPQFGRLGKRLDLVMDLLGEFTGRRNHERPHPPPWAVYKLV